jgi:hypothetical protein
MCTCRTYSYSSMMLAVCHRSLRSVLSPCDGTLLYPTCTCGTCSYSFVTLAFHHRSLRVPAGPFSIRLVGPDNIQSFLYLGTLLHRTCTCGTCSCSSVTLAFRHRSLCVPAGPFSISDLWDPSCVHVGPSSISLRPVGPKGLCVTCTCGIFRPVGPNGSRVTCSCGIFCAARVK